MGQSLCWIALPKYTTGFTGFAECQLHSAKARLHSAKALPSVLHSAKPLAAKGALPSAGFRALGKGFAESLALGIAATWRDPGRALCRVPDTDTRQSSRPVSRHVAALPSAGSWHSANFQIFAECQDFSTRQSSCPADLARLLCRVFWHKHSAKWLNFFCFYFLCFSI